jgi:hypothetical protein
VLDPSTVLWAITAAGLVSALVGVIGRRARLGDRQQTGIQQHGTHE